MEASVLSTLFSGIWGHFFTRPQNLEPYKQSWTVITGCTDGIGRAYLEELVATKGIRKLFLIARNSTKLESLSSYLKETYEGCEIKTAIFDFEKDDFEQMPYELQSLEVGILINCAGTAPDRVANFANLPIGLSSAILRVNLLSCVKMIELILPGMLKRDRGIIVNFSSITGWRPLPYMSTYPASKAAISFFTDSLGDEFAHTNVKIQCLFPLLVATKLTQYASEDANLFVLDTKSYARQAVNIIGNYRISTGCFVHDMQIAFGSLIGFNLFKLFYVPFGILGIHKKRFDAYRMRVIETEEAKSGGIKSE
uniref:Steroid dehydrogenase n=1 Tax=Globodera rostochiensis TaxID=31243 RepID=A0A914H1H1_GLORO